MKPSCYSVPTVGRALSFAIVGLLTLLAPARADLIVTGDTNEVSLGEALLADGGGVSNVIVSLSGSATNATFSSGTYVVTNPPTTYGLATNGIVLSTGNVEDYSSGTNANEATTTAYGAAGTLEQNALLTPISGVSNHFDVTQLDLTFDVAAGVTNLSVCFVFGSEEFPEGGLGENDAFGIFLNGVNIAVVDGAPVRATHPDMIELAGTELDGVLAPGSNAVVKLTFPVEAGSVSNTLTFIIGDSTDDITDSTVYLSALGGVTNAPPPPPPAGDVDLTGEWTEVTVKCKDKAGVPNCKIKGRLLISNLGSADADNSRVRFWLSDDDQLDEGDTLAKEVSSGKVKPDKPKKKTASLKSSGDPGALFLIAEIDADNVVEEADEDNNVIVFGPLGD